MQSRRLFKSSVLFCACVCVQAPATAQTKTHRKRLLCICGRSGLLTLIEGCEDRVVFIARISTCAIKVSSRGRAYGSTFESLSLRKPTKQKGIEKSIPFVFYTFVQVYLLTKGMKNKNCRLADFCVVGLQGPLRRAVGKGVKRSRL